MTDRLNPEEREILENFERCELRRAAGAQKARWNRPGSRREAP